MKFIAQRKTAATNAANFRTTVLAFVAAVCFALFVSQQMELASMQRRIVELRRAFPEFDGAGPFPRITKAEDIHSTCQRYYIAVGPDQTVKPEIRFGDRQTFYDPVRGRSTGRIFQIWVGVHAFTLGSSVNIFVEEISPDGRSLMQDLSPKAAQFSHFVGRASLFLSATTISLPKGTVEQLGEKTILARGDDGTTVTLSLETLPKQSDG